MSLQGFLADHLMPAQINDQIFKYLNQFASKAKGLTTMGMIVLFVTSVMTMMTVESAFNVIWRVRKPRPLAQRVQEYGFKLGFVVLFTLMAFTLINDLTKLF